MARLDNDFEATSPSQSTGTGPSFLEQAHAQYIKRKSLGQSSGLTLTSSNMALHDVVASTWNVAEQWFSKPCLAWRFHLLASSSPLGWDVVAESASQNPMRPRARRPSGEAPLQRQSATTCCPPSIRVQSRVEGPCGGGKGGVGVGKRREGWCVCATCVLCVSVI